MRSCILKAGVDRQHPESRKSLGSGATLWKLWRYFPLGLLVFALGCGSHNKMKEETAEVTGKVLFKGKGLPGGRVTFISDGAGALAVPATIDEEGNYKLSAPVGPVHITVDNRDLDPKRSSKGPSLKNPNQPKPTPMKGKFVSIKPKYFTADSTDLTYTVEPGPQTKDITVE